MAKQSIVAIFGEIIPAPLPIAVMAVCLPSIFIFFEEVFENASVVIIASEASFMPFSERCFTSPGMAFLIFLICEVRNEPITPVDDGITNASFIFSSFATDIVISFASIIPCLPVHTLAIPLFITTA